jgi:hypothetical protein
MHQPTTLRLGRQLALALVMALGVVSCGGDLVAGIQGSGSPLANGASAVGPVSGFGSIFLDGIEYSTSAAQIRIDDQAATESQLRVGQIVSLKGSVNADGVTGNATEVSFTADLRGPITQIDASGATFVVLKQTVRVSDATLFDDRLQPNDLSGLQVGAVVEVSGFADSTGAFVASRIDPAMGSSALQVGGMVQGLDTLAHTFQINALTVDYSSVAPTGTLANGVPVNVQGTSLSGAGVLIASRVRVLTVFAGAANDRGQLEGIVTKFTSAADFEVAGQRVITDANTELVARGATIALDVPVKVRGAFNAAGVLVASRVEIKPRSLSVVRGLVDSVSAAANTLTVLGVAVTVSAATEFEDKSSQHLRSFALADVRTGDYVEVRGTPGANAGLDATVLERDRPEDRSSLQGVVTALASPNFTILGRTITTDAQTHFLGLGGPSSAPDQFFATAQGQSVRVRGERVGSVLLAEEVQIRH